MAAKKKPTKRPPANKAKPARAKKKGRKKTALPEPGTYEAAKLARDSQKPVSRDDEAHLPPKQRRFVEEYMLDRNAIAAYARAGYKAKNYNTAGVMASRLLRNDKVAAAIARRDEENAAKLKVTPDRIRAEWWDNSQRCKQQVPVLDAFGNPTGEWKFDVRGSNEALRDLAKSLGMMDDRIRVKMEGQIEHKHSLVALSAADLDKLPVPVLEQLLTVVQAKQPALPAGTPPKQVVLLPEPEKETAE